MNIVERLRFFAEYEADIADEDKHERVEWLAADRIEQLESSLKQIRLLLTSNTHNERKALRIVNEVIGE